MTIKVYNHHNEHIADIQEIPNELKGKYEYWISCFEVEDLSDTKSGIIRNGGKLITDEGYRMLCTDNSDRLFSILFKIDD